MASGSPHPAPVAVAAALLPVEQRVADGAAALKLAVMRVRLKKPWQAAILQPRWAMLSTSPKPLPVTHVTGSFWDIPAAWQEIQRFRSMPIRKVLHASLTLL